MLPGSLVTTLAAATALDRSGDEALRQKVLTELIAGRRRVSIACEEANGEWGPEHVAMVAEPSTDGRELVLSGTKILVPDGSVATLFLVVARVGEGLAFLPVAADAAGLTVTPMQRIDGDDVAELRFAEVRVPVSAVLGGAAAEALVRSTYDRWTVLLAANLLGDAEAVLHQTNEYARQRVQFGRPIGSFQAVQHMLANVWIDVEAAWLAAYEGISELERGDATATHRVCAARCIGNEAFTRACFTAHQVLGGMGFMWETDLHLWTRKAKEIELGCGGLQRHRDLLAGAL
jgi:alkylation response protein AidB-like acyl-CoA dehydrogenase